MGVEVTPEAEAAQEAQFKAEISEQRAIALEAGGLFVLGTERHESRRIDNQLRGRTGRQGDPGTSKFYLSCEDDLLRIFAGDRLDSIMKTFGVAEGEAITHPWLNKAIEQAQKKVEQRNYDIRKNLLKYDDVVNDVPIDVGADHQGGNLIVISKIEGGKWIEVGRVDPTKSN